MNTNEYYDDRQEKPRRRPTKLERNLILAIIVIIAIALIYCGWRIYKLGADSNSNKISELESQIEHMEDPTAAYEQVDSSMFIQTITEKFQGIGELNTIEYMYTNCERLDDSQKVLIEAFKSTKTLIVQYDGVIKAGVDLTKIEVSTDNENKTIHVKVPDTYITSHEIDQDSVEIIYSDNGLFNKVSPEDLTKLQASSKETMNEKATSRGLLNQASENAKTMIREMMTNDELTNAGYTIVFDE